MSEEGFVPTPSPVTDWLSTDLFVDNPTASDNVLLPGCGTGQFAAAIRRCCSYRGYTPPAIHAVESNDERAAVFQERFESSSESGPSIPEDSKYWLDIHYPPGWKPSYDAVTMEINFYHRDFLLDPPAETFEYIIANPPFVQYNNIDADKRERYSERFPTATGRFNLYAPFVEQMCNLLSENGSLVCILPEGFLFSTNAALRKRIREETVHYVWPLPKAIFSDQMVRTVALVVSADPSLGLNGSFNVDSWNYIVDIEQILAGVGVCEADRDQHVEQYQQRLRDLANCIRARRRVGGEDAGYNTAVDPMIDNDHQADLGAWG